LQVNPESLFGFLGKSIPRPKLQLLHALPAPTQAPFRRWPTENLGQSESIECPSFQRLYLQRFADHTQITSITRFADSHNENFDTPFDDPLKSKPKKDLTYNVGNMRCSRSG
jgi:hypothetical protein